MEEILIGVPKKKKEKQRFSLHSSVSDLKIQHVSGTYCHTK